MANFFLFLKGVSTHWGWLTIALIALFLYGSSAFGGDTKVKMALILVAIASIAMALYLTVSGQLTALNRFLEVG
jgi:hypothetical protein